MLGSTSATFATVVAGILKTMNSLVWLLSGVAMAIFMWGMALYIFKNADSKQHQKGAEFIKWGIIALFIIFSLSGILKLACTSFFGDGAC